MKTIAKYFRMTAAERRKYLSKHKLNQDERKELMEIIQVISSLLDNEGQTVEMEFEVPPALLPKKKPKKGGVQ